MKLNILIACEKSQAECIDFRELGHNAYSCDIQPCRPSGHPEWHIKAGVLPLLDGCEYFITQDKRPHRVRHWHLIICHPPCTYLCKVSSVWMHDGGGIVLERYYRMKMARDFFQRCLNAKADYVAVENPLPMAIAELPPPSCFIQQSWFGVRYTKKTLYWLRNLPPIMAEIVNPNTKQFVRSSRGKYRSRTFPEVATAIARQWSDYIITQLEKQSTKQQ